MVLLEALSYLVTIFGLPFAIAALLLEQRKERRNEDEEIYQRLSDEYAAFLRLVLDNSDLLLMGRHESAQALTDEQRERKLVMFEILVALFERAYILVYEENPDRQTQRLWSSWEDYMREWCRREDFRALLPKLLEGEDPDFQRYILGVVEREQRGMQAPMPTAAGPGRP